MSVDYDAIAMWGIRISASDVDNFCEFLDLGRGIESLVKTLGLAYTSIGDSYTEREYVIGPDVDLGDNPNPITPEMIAQMDRAVEAMGCGQRPRWHVDLYIS